MNAAKTIEISRRQLFRGDMAGRHLPLRPPWAVAETEFTDRCDRCNDCIYACPERVIRFGSGGFPEMDFSERGCTLCRECVVVCGGKALTGDPASDRSWSQTAEIADTCLANRGVVCRSCGEVCDQRAILFELRVGGAAQPRLDVSLCTGCGFCVGVCPVRAMAVKAAPESRTVRLA